MSDSSLTVKDIVDKTNLRDVRIIGLGARVDIITSKVTVDFNAGDINVARDGSEMLVRFEHSATFIDSDSGNTAAEITIAHMARFTVEDENLELTDDDEGVMQAWVLGNVYFMVYPYVRESIQDTCMRLGLPVVVLGYLARDEHAPRSLTLLVNSTTYHREVPADQPLPLEDLN